MDEKTQPIPRYPTGTMAILALSLPLKTLRIPPCSSEQEGLYDLEFKWWLEDWKEYVLSQNYYLYWAEGGIA